ncbi:hypothetical protein niasHT_032172 [Heterodera trifolii]|uniref:Uncharacterized protein n=1 Tax=Heterodera trifolii TaxID=157864 RepID=A0ABD2HXZ2_9BILA
MPPLDKIFSCRLKGIELNIFRGDIVMAETDAIAILCDPDFKLNAGVGRAIRNTGGQDFMVRFLCCWLPFLAWTVILSTKFILQSSKKRWTFELRVFRCLCLELCFPQLIPLQIICGLSFSSFLHLVVGQTISFLRRFSGQASSVSKEKQSAEFIYAPSQHLPGRLLNAVLHLFE